MMEKDFFNDPRIGPRPAAWERPSLVIGAQIRIPHEGNLQLEIDPRVGVAQLLQALVGAGLILSAVNGESLYVMRREDWAREPGPDIAITSHPIR